jgi:DNA replication protein DnaC
MEIIDDRAALKATIIRTQLPIDHWHGWIGDAILDRLMQKMQHITLRGESMRSRARGPNPPPTDPKRYRS